MVGRASPSAPEIKDGGNCIDLKGHIKQEIQQFTNGRHSGL